MTYELRRPIFDLQGSLLVGIGPSDTQIRSSRFQSLATDYSSGSYLPLTIQDSAKSEIVWVTAHVSASDGLTVVRAREGTSAATFDATAVVRCTPTLRDVVSAVANRSSLPSDAHYGCRMLILNEGQVVEKTSAGWNDSAPFEKDANRKYLWNQSGAPLTPGGEVIISGLGGSNPGSLCTLNAGVITTAVDGVWTFSLGAYTDHGSAGWMLIKLQTNFGGLWPTDRRHRAASGFNGSGQLDNFVAISPTYIPSGSTVTAIAQQANAAGSNITGGSYVLTAEYLGR